MEQEIKQPFNYLGYYDTYNMHQSIKNMTEEDWLYWTHRQEAFKDYHGSTKCIPILRDDSYSKNERGEETIFYNEFKKDIIKIEKYLNQVLGKGEIIRAEIPLLPAGTKVNPHYDDTESFVIQHRVHIPIITSPEIIFTIDGIDKNLKIGEIWEIDNTKMHGVNNPSDIDRIHLIVDFKKAPSSLL